MWTLIKLTFIAAFLTFGIIVAIPQDRVGTAANMVAKAEAGASSLPVLDELMVMKNAVANAWGSKGTVKYGPDDSRSSLANVVGVVKTALSLVSTPDSPATKKLPGSGVSNNGLSNNGLASNGAGGASPAIPAANQEELNRLMATLKQRSAQQDP